VVFITQRRVILKVDVLCANYNNAKFLSEFLDSLYSSTYPFERIIFVDDASTDNSIDIVSDYIVRNGCNNIFVIPLKENVGFANALNEGANFIISDFVLRIDPDDVLVPDRVVKQLRVFSNDNEIGVVGGQAQYFLSQNRRIRSKTAMPLYFKDISKAFLNADNGVLHGTVMAKSELFRKYNYEQGLVPSEDYDIFTRMYRDGVRMCNIPDVVVLVRVHEGSVSNDVKFKSVEKIYKIREKNLSIPYSRVSLFLEFVTLKYYRRYLYEARLIRYFYLALAIICSPWRLLRRIKRWF
jgi:glycosyltransferase involved in cell wall biosynthesis